MRPRKHNKAFTIVELLVVIFIISLLAAFVAPRMFRERGPAMRKISKAKMATVASAIERFHLDCGRYPDDSQGLTELLEKPEDVAEKWNGPYLRKGELLDAWDREFIYIEEGQVNPGYFDLISYAADGAEGGEGDNEDVYYE